MKKLLLTALTFLSIGLINAQTSLYLEDFDTTPISMTASSSGVGSSWTLNTNYQVSGTSSDSAQVTLGDTLYLESNAFSTMGFTFVTLNFSQICKIDFFDKGIVEYSTNNGSNWTQLTSAEYIGGGFMSANAFSAISYTNWAVGNNSAIPAASWWQNEAFDLTATAGNTQVKVRFVLIDADNNGSRSNYGWLLDDVEVLGSPCELIPPTIALTGTMYQGAVFGTGPYNVQADIQDASGIATASLDYTVNGGASSTVSMVFQSGTTYQGTIPAANVGDTICYIIYATDNTTCSNMAQFPNSGCTQFIVNPNAPPNCLGNPISTYNYSETFSSFSAGNGTSTVGSLNNDWANSTTDTHDWWVLNRATNSGNTGPSSDHSPGDANYLYVEASGGFANKTAIINSPCYNFSSLNAPKFSFWYHMFGNNMGELHVDIYSGGAWILDVTPAIIGNQGNLWLFREIDLTAYTGSIVQLRFRGITGSNFQSDIAIDDIEIIEPIANELSFSGFVTPNASSCNGSAAEVVTISIENLGSITQDTTPVAYRVNGGAIVRDTSFLNLAPSASFNFTFQQTFDMSTPGSYSIDAWIELANDGDRSNDSNFNYTVTTNGITNLFPDTANFDNFTVGVPGVFMGGWDNEPNNTYDWYVHTAGTPSVGTGPTGDTTSVAGTGNYIYYEATNVPQGEEGSFFSECFDINNLSKPELSFWYHMSGLDMGELHLDLSINGFLIQDLIPVISGDQGTQWLNKIVDLTPYKGDIRLVFRATRGTGFRSDVAIDQVSIRDAQPVSVKESSLENDLSIYPNPIKNSMLISLERSSQIEVYNSMGALILTETLNKGKSIIDASNWPSGFYFVSVQSENEKLVKKIVKQ